MCCGVNSPDDWKKLNGSIYLPPSCCHKDIDNPSTCLEEDAFKVGCKKALIDFLQEKIEYIASTLAGVGVFQVRFKAFHLLNTNLLRFILWFVNI